MYVSLRTKIIMGIVGLLGLTVICVHFAVGNNVRSNFEREFLKRAVFSGFGVAERVRPLLSNGNIAATEQVLVRYRNERPDVRYIFVRERGKKVITAVPANPPGLNLIPLEASGEPYTVLRFNAGRDHIADICVPIEGGTKGYVHLGMSEASVIEAISETTKITMLMSCGIIFLGGIMAAFMASILTKPIPELIRVSRAVGQGDLDQRVTFSAGDEMGALGRSVNEMIGGLKKSRDELTAAKNYTEKIVRSMGDILLVVGLGCDVKTASPSCQGSLGYYSEELLGQSVGMLYLDGESAFRSRILDRVVRGEKITDHLFEGRAKNGVSVPMSLSATPMQEPGGAVSGAVVIARDRSDVEKLLHEVDQIYNGSLSAMRVVDEKFNIISANQAFCKMVGVDKNQIRGTKCYELFRSVRCRTEDCNLVQIMRGKSRLDVECDREASDGKKISVRVLATPYRDRNGGLAGIIEVFSDITEQKKLISALEQKTYELGDSYETQRNYAQIVTVLNSPAEFKVLLTNALSKIAECSNAQLGLIYLWDDASGKLVPAATCALNESLVGSFALGEGLPGQAARQKEMILLEDVPPDYFRVASGTSEGLPRNIACLPICFGDGLVGVLELAGCKSFEGKVIDQLKIIGTQLGISIYQAQLHLKTEQLAGDLKEKTDLLVSQNSELWSQGEELASLNEELQSQTEELSRQKRELEQKTRQLQEADQMKSEFLSNMSHELRTPLNAILGMTALLRSGPERTGQEETYLPVIERNGYTLLQLINDILDLSKIESGRLELNCSDIILKDFLDDTVSGIAPLARENRLSIGVSVTEDVGPICSDPDKLRQVMINLLSNAIKFTDEGGSILISVRPDGPEMIEIEVCDTGVGIPEQSLPSIFDAFRQVAIRGQSKYKGTGLGLSIVKKLITVLKGEISVKSSLGSGTTFAIKLPRESNECRKSIEIVQNRIEEVRRVLGPFAQEIEKEPFEMSERKILIVEDQPDNLFFLEEILRPQGYIIYTASDGREAIEISQVHKPDLILMDVQMPVMDGYEATRRIRSLSNMDKVPVIALTARAMTGEFNRALEAGCSDYLSKPVAPAEVLEKIRKWMA